MSWIRRQTTAGGLTSYDQERQPFLSGCHETRSSLRCWQCSSPVAVPPAPAPRQPGRGAAAAHHLPGRGELRRGRRPRARRRGKFIADAQPDDFEVLEDGKPQKVTAFSLVNIPVERAEQPAVRRQADRARRQDQPAGRRRPHLPDRARRPAHRRPAVTAGEGGGPPVHRAATSAPTTSPPSSTPAGAATRRRTSPATSACCCAPSTSSWAASSGRRTLNRIDEELRTRSQREAGSGEAHRRIPTMRERGCRPATPSRPCEKLSRVPRRHPRPAQGAGALQRGHRLRHQRRLQQRPMPRPIMNATRDVDRRGDAGQRGGLRRRPARPHHRWATR